MIDQVNALMEDLIRKLTEQLKNNKKKFKREELLNDDGKNIISINSFENESYENTADLIDKKSNENNNKELSFDEVYNKVEIIYKKIKKYMTNIDLFAMNTIKLFRPWKKFLRISSDIGSRLLQINQEGLEIDDDYSKRKKSLAYNITFSVENKFNIMITLFHGFFYCFSFISMDCL
jgi:hypothetical protein